MLDNCSFFYKLNLNILFEIDLVPSSVSHFISRFPRELFGINYDIGNSASLGYSPLEEFSNYGDRIKNVHIKDRLLGGSTVPLFTGNANFDLIFNLFSKYGYQGNFIFQTARAVDGNHSELLLSYTEYILRLMKDLMTN